MWKIWTRDSVRYNKSSSRSIRAAAFTAAFFLSLLCSLFYNMWTDQIRQIETTQGNWHVTLIRQLDPESLQYLKSHAGVDEVKTSQPDQMNESLPVTEIYFDHMADTYSIMPEIAQVLDLQPDEYVYNDLLLSEHLVFNPEDRNPPLLLIFELILLLCVCLMLFFLLKNSFEFTMRSRIKQLGLLASAGANPSQTKTALIQEAVVLTLLPILAGTAAGIAAGWLLIQILFVTAKDFVGSHDNEYSFSIWVIVGCWLLLGIAVGLSVWIPARKLSQITVLEAFRTQNAPALKKERQAHLYRRLFGIEGELAALAIKSQKKTMRTGTIVLTIGFLAFTLSLSFLTLSDISTNETYFLRYADAWDVLSTIPRQQLDGSADQNSILEEIRSLDHVQDAAIYQTVLLQAALPAKWQSENLVENGGLNSYGTAQVNPAAENNDSSLDSDSQITYRLPAQTIVMDDASYQRYCLSQNLESDLNQAVVVNSFWDSLHSPSLDKQYIPLLGQTHSVILSENITDVSINHLLTLPLEDSELETSMDSVSLSVPLNGFAAEMPQIRQALDPSGMNVIVSETLWNSMSHLLEVSEDKQRDVNLRLLADDSQNLDVLESLQTLCDEVLKKNGLDFESENRIQAKNNNNRMYAAYRAVIGFFCSLMGAAGLLSIFFHAVSFLQIRHREFAQYISLGMDSRQIRNILRIESWTMALKPILLVLPLFTAGSCLLAELSSVDQHLFWSRTPYLELALYSAAIIGSTLLAYRVGSQKIRTMNPAEEINDNSI